MRVYTRARRPSSEVRVAQDPVAAMGWNAGAGDAGLQPAAWTSDGCEASPRQAALPGAAGHSLSRLSVFPGRTVTVSEPGDFDEVEADRWAERALSRPEPSEAGPSSVAPVSHPTAAPVEPAQVRRQADAGEAEDSASHVEGASHVAVPVAPGGAPLPQDVRRSFEPRFGHDFSRVRIYDDAAAAEAAAAVDARSFAVGSDIYFAAGQYAPYDPAGRRLLAHELAHVAQDAGSGKRVRRWKDDGHIATTTDAANDVFSDPAAMGFFSTIGIPKATFITRLAQASVNMDKIVPHLADRFNPLASEGPKFWSFSRTLVSSALTDLLPGNQRKGKTRRGIKGEGPDHGEAGYYDVPRGAAIPGNVARTNKYLDESVQAFTGHDYDTMINRLGDACHVAADRGSHAEGGQGEGHDTRMPDPDAGEKGTDLKAGFMENWADNDSMALNPDGYQIGLAHATETLTAFLHRVTGTSAPTGAADLAAKQNEQTA